MPRRGVRRTGGALAPLLTALVFLVALNLRPGLTAVGPVLPQIGADLGLTESAQGLLGSLPVLAFAAASPLVPRLAARLGSERAVLLALVLLAAGLITRSYGGFFGLWAGTVVAGCAIAVGNVLVPAIVKRDYPARISQATGVYAAFMAIAAATASGIAVPLSSVWDWRGALAFWAIPALVVAALWTARALPPVRSAARRTAEASVPVSIWRQPGAWLLTVFMGLQSTSFYFMITWLPTIEITAGNSPERAGLHLLGYQLVGILGSLLIPRLMRSPDSQVTAAVTASATLLIAVVGLLFAPQLGVLWALTAGFGSGSSLVVALSLISLRGRTPEETTRLSGMVQSLGYLLAAAGPVLAGAIAEATGGWQMPLVLIAVIVLVQLLVAVPAGTPRYSGLRG